MGRRKIARNEWQEEYAFRRLLGAVLVEAVLDGLSQGAAWKDRTSALDFLHDENVQALCEAHLVLPPGLWRAFAEAADQGVVIDYAVVAGLGDHLASASPAKQSATLTGQTKASAAQPARRASSPRKRRPASESHGQAGAPPAVTVIVERTLAPEPATQPASSGGLLSLMRRVQQAVGRPAAAGAG
jgi:hypothetical protein